MTFPLWLGILPIFSVRNISGKILEILLFDKEKECRKSREIVALRSNDNIQTLNSDKKNSNQ
jgi:hypothetical protein